MKQFIEVTQTKHPNRDLIINVNSISYIEYTSEDTSTIYFAGGATSFVVVMGGLASIAQKIKDLGNM